MWIKKAVKLLQITKTNNKKRIERAYKKCLLFYNTEEDEESALESVLSLQQAYKTALEYAEKPEDEERIFEDAAILETDEKRVCVSTSRISLCQ